MNKLVIFDLDGVLVDSQEIHYETFNRAILEIDSRYVITRDENLTTYNGVTTQTKLDLLTEKKGMPKSLHRKIWDLKQAYTFEEFNQLKEDNKLIEICKSIQSQGFKIAVATNSIRQTTKIILLRLGIMEFVDVFVTNQDVSKPKPYPEMYWRCMTITDSLPYTTLIVEDSPEGREGAKNSGAHVCEVSDPNDVTMTKIQNCIFNMSNFPEVKEYAK